MKFEYVFFVFFAIIVGHIAWRFFRSGSIAGSHAWGEDQAGDWASGHKRWKFLFVIRING